jgi:predicted nucleic acid-binding protein
LNRVKLARAPEKSMNSILIPSQLNASASLSQKVASFSNRLRLEREACELERKQHRAAQINESNASCVRVAAWEKLHALQLPSVDAQVSGPLATDAALASLALEQGATLCSTDRDFRDFGGST